MQKKLTAEEAESIELSAVGKHQTVENMEDELFGAQRRGSAHCCIVRGVGRTPDQKLAVDSRSIV